MTAKQWRVSLKGRRWLRKYERSMARRLSRNRRQVKAYNTKAETRKRILASGARSRKKYWNRVKTYVRSEKVRQGCKQCGFRKHFAALEFHHRKRTQKLFEVATAVSKCIGFDRVKMEMAKCDVLCSNCHRILTFKEKQHGRKR